MSRTDQRNHPRYPIENAIIATSKGIFQIRNICLGGFSLKSTSQPSEHTEIFFDILNTDGDHIQDLTAELVWEKNKVMGNADEAFCYEAGASFKNLTQLQALALKSLVLKCQQK